jgi:hypothetical protein
MEAEAAAAERLQAARTRLTVIVLLTAQSYVGRGNMAA